MTHADAAMLLSWIPSRRRHQLAVNVGYPKPAEAHLTATDTSPDMYGQVRAVGRPLYIKAPDAPIDFRETAHWKDHLEPAGFQDGLTACLLAADGRYTGMLHLSAASITFTEWTRQLVTALEHALARLSDRRTVRLQDLGLATDLPALLVMPDGEAVELTDHPTVEAHDDTHLRLVGRQFLRTGAGTARFMWAYQGQWFRVHLTRVRASPWWEPAVLIAADRDDLPYGMTPRELEVLTYVTVGAGNKSIAADLAISPRTVSTHVERILDKLHCLSRAGAAAFAAREGLMTLQPERTSPALLHHVLASDTAGNAAVRTMTY